MEDIEDLGNLLEKSTVLQKLKSDKAEHGKLRHTSIAINEHLSPYFFPHTACFS